MDPLRLRFAGTDAPEITLTTGMHGIGTDARGVTGRVEDAAAAAICFCVDRRGVWLAVREGVAGVHVNGRPVRRMAMLRAGDTIHADGSRMVLTMARQRQPPAALSANDVADGSGDPRTVLRGIGGRLHGRSFTLDRPRMVGSASDADVRIDDPAVAGRLARIELQGVALVLRHLDSSDGSLLNGEPVRDALLLPGDQLVFGNHRFLIEAPGNNQEHPPATSGVDQIAKASGALHAQPGSNIRRLPWLLLAAVLIAAVLAALLLFGVSGSTAPA